MGRWVGPSPSSPGEEQAQAARPTASHDCRDFPIILQGQDQSFFFGSIFSPSRKIFLLIGS